MNTPPVYEVLYWGSHPDAGNDDCYCGSSFSNLADAKEAFETARPSEGYFVELTGPDVYGVRQVASDAYIKQAQDRDAREWRREIANEAGMLGGCDAYNEVMGY